MEDYTVRQGDQYSISFPIMLNRFIVTTDIVDSENPELSGDVEIVIGNLRKTLQKGEVKFNTFTYTFDFPLTQKETFAWRPGMILKSQVRVKLKSFNQNDNNLIYSYDGPTIRVIQSMSKESI